MSAPAPSGLRPLFVLQGKLHGGGKVVFGWNPAGTLLCTCGNNGLARVFDRSGSQIAEVQLESRAQCTAIDWDRDGEAVVVLQAGVDRVAVFELAPTRGVFYVDTGLREPTFAKWSPSAPTLAVGSAKGGLLIFRRDSRKRLPITGKHSGAISCGDWSPDGRLALGGADSILTISSAEGDTVDQTELRYAPLALQFTTPKGGAVSGGGEGGTGGGVGGASGGVAGEGSVSVNMGGKTVLLYSLTDPEHPVELAFQARYGRVVSHRGFGGGTYMLLGFSEGYVVIISTHAKEVGEELFSSGRLLKDPLEDVAVSEAAGRAAAAGGSCVRLIDTALWKEAKNEFAQCDPAHGAIGSIAWTGDGQILTASTRSGHVYAFLARLPSVVASAGPRIAFVSSLREITVTSAVDVSAAANDVGPGEGSVLSTIPHSVLVPVTVEPAFLGLGPSHVAVGVNTHLWFYRTDGGAARLVAERDYPGTIETVLLSHTLACVLTGGRMFVHSIEGSGGGGGGTGVDGGEDDVRILPQGGDEGGNGGGTRLTCAAIGGDFLFLGTAGGSVCVYSLREGLTQLTNAELRLGDGTSNSPSIVGVWSNVIGTRLVVSDSLNRYLLFNPVEAKALLIPDVQPDSRVMWDAVDRHVFVLTASPRSGRGGGSLTAYLHAPLTITGPTVAALGSLDISPTGEAVSDPASTPLPSNAIPVVLLDGIAVSHIPGDGLATTILVTHNALHARGARLSIERSRAVFSQNLNLQRLPAAWESASALGASERAAWIALAGKAMEVLDLETAKRAYRALGDVGMVQSLEGVARGSEDRTSACGSMALLFGDFDLAQDLFLASSHPAAALDMQRDLLKWDTALKLAATVAPQEMPAISLELAKQLEWKGEHAQALSMYTASLQQATTAAAAAAPAGAKRPPGGSPPSGRANTLAAAAAEHVRRACAAGVARCTLRLGDVRKGAALAAESGDLALCRECGAICESLKQPAEAAALYRRAECWDKAFALLLAAKNYSAAAPLLARVSSPKLHAVYARAKEAEGDFEAAADAFERARDIDAVVRLLVDRLGAADRAGDIVRATRSREGAGVLARHCVSKGDTKGAIEFLLLARRRNDAFDLAVSGGEMGVYVTCLRAAVATAAGYAPAASAAAAAAAAASNGVNGAGSPPLVPLPVHECERIGAYFEARGDAVAAARMFGECGHHAKALTLLLAVGGESCITEAIALAGSALSEGITGTLLDYLTGEVDGAARDPRHVFRLYMAVRDYKQAAKTAHIIARGEQEAGNYKAAHVLLFDTHAALTAVGARVPQELVRSLTLLHSYLLVKKLVKAEDHEAAARMTVRVAKSISRFPAHVAPILTSTVIECQRAGLKRTAWEYACVLMRPEHRDGVEEKFRKKIEALVRRPHTEEEMPEALTPCPFCDAPLAASELSCDSCKSEIPLCCVTGKHMTAGDCSQCPSCAFPALHSALLACASAPDATCPMCSAPITPGAVALLRDPLPVLRRAAGLDVEATEPQT